VTRRLPLALGVEHVLLALLAVGVGTLAGVDPASAALAVLGMAFALIVLVDITAGLCLFTALAFLDQIPALGSALTLTKLAGLVLAASWLTYVTTRDRGGPNFASAHGTFLFVLVAFVAWTALSALWAENPGEVAVSVSRYLPNVLLFVIAFTAVTSRRRALAVIVAFVGAATLSAVYGLISPAQFSEQEGFSRFGGSIGDPNEFAALVLVALVLALTLAAVARRAPALRAMALGSVVLCTLAVFQSLSRGALVALAAALIVGIIVADRWRWAVVAVTVVVALSGLVYFTTFASPAARERITYSDGGSGRTDIWTVGWRMVEAEPLHGIGAGNFQLSSVHYLLRPGSIIRVDFIVDTPKVAHNIYLQVLAELGVVGLALFLGIIGFSLTCAVRAARRFEADGDLRMATVARGVLVGLVGLLAAYFFVSEQYSKQLWLLLGLAPSLLAIARAGVPEGAPGSD